MAVNVKSIFAVCLFIWRLLQSLIAGCGKYRDNKPGYNFSTVIQVGVMGSHFTSSLLFNWCKFFSIGDIITASEEPSCRVVLVG